MNEGITKQVVFANSLACLVTLARLRRARVCTYRQKNSKEKLTVELRAVRPALALMASLLLAQGAAAQSYVYPSKGQSAEQQKKDETECSSWASQQTGVNPSAPAPTVQATSGGGNVVRGGAGGAALGAIGGAIAGHAGEGAAIGAAIGAARGLFQRFGQAREQEQAQSQVDAQHQQGLQNYNKAYAACLTGRGYTVN